MDEVFGHNILISCPEVTDGKGFVGRWVSGLVGFVARYNDSSPISPLPSLLVGTQAPGNPAELYICPKVGNLLQGRSISSSSVAFNGVPEKAVDGQWGDNTFCEYCAQNDPLHVCASTRRQEHQRRSTVPKYSTSLKILDFTCLYVTVIFENLNFRTPSVRPTSASLWGNGCISSPPSAWWCPPTGAQSSRPSGPSSWLEKTRQNGPVEKTLPNDLLYG